MNKSNNGTNGEYKFITSDPQGREVRLKSSTWDFHITGGDHDRTELNGEEEIVRNVVENPYFILKDNPENLINSTRQKYLDIVSLEAFDKLKSLVVVVDHEKEEYSNIVTIVAKSKINESTKGGPVYVRGKSTDK